MFELSRKVYYTTKRELNYMNYSETHKVLVTLYTAVCADLLIRLLMRAEQMSWPSRIKFLKVICCSWFWRSCNRSVLILEQCFKVTWLSIIQHLTQKMYNQRQSCVTVQCASYMFQPQHGHPQGDLQQKNKKWQMLLQMCICGVKNKNVFK
jgi:hypothetical protein